MDAISSDKLSHQAHLNPAQYDVMYTQSLKDPEKFWAIQAEKFVTWYKSWDSVLSGNFEQLNVEWFKGAKLNACYNCVDRHLPKRAKQTAIQWVGDDPQEEKKITYAELQEKISRLANVLKKHGIKKGDRVCIYLPMIPEGIIAMLACARIGAIHSVIFGGFSANSIKERILDADCRLVITANEGIRGNKIIPLKKNIDSALEECPDTKTVIVVKRTNNKVNWIEGRDYSYEEEMESVSAECPCEELDALDPLFILYTSGSTGKPKGILHSIGGYLVYAAITHYTIFDYREGEMYWCSADIGWITGHSYGVYGPLCNGATVLLFEGVPNYPTFSRYWEIIDKYNVAIFYTSPTAIRSLRREGDEPLKNTHRQSLRILGTVGEPINPDVWEWYYTKVGNSQCPIVDTWWQTETGGILISPIPGATRFVPGSVTGPFFGIEPSVVDEKGNELPANTMGKLVIKKPWPGIMKTVYGDSQRFKETYFAEFPGKYLTGDNAYVDEEGCYWIRGRNDDVLKVSGHRIGTGELENVLLQHVAVAEAAVVGIPHEIKGESIYAFITLKADTKPSEELKKELIAEVRASIGPIAAPDHIQWAEALPKTRSGKIMRRLLRKIAANELDDLGDTSTLADPGVVEGLIRRSE